MFISVVLPLPDAPTIATYSPRSIRRLTPRSACTAMSPTAYVLWTSTSSITGAPREPAIAAGSRTAHRWPAAAARTQARVRLLGLTPRLEHALRPRHRGATRRRSSAAISRLRAAEAAPPPPPPRKNRHRHRAPPSAAAAQRPAERPLPVPELPVEVEPSDGSAIVITSWSPALTPLMICVRESPRSPTTTCWETSLPFFISVDRAERAAAGHGLVRDRDARRLAGDHRRRRAHPRLDPGVVLIERQRRVVGDDAAAGRSHQRDRADVGGELDAGEGVERDRRGLPDLDLADVGLAERDGHRQRVRVDDLREPRARAARRGRPEPPRLPAVAARRSTRSPSPSSTTSDELLDEPLEPPPDTESPGVRLDSEAIVPLVGA